MSLEKRIKRHVMGRGHDLFAVTLPGYERICETEIKRLSDTAVVTAVHKGGVAFSGRLTDIYLANLHVRTTGRILMRLVRFKATNFKQLESHVRKFPWELYLSPGSVPDVNVTTRHSRLYHTGAVAERIAQAIVHQWAESGTALSDTGAQALYIRIRDDRVTVSLDSSGDALYRRGLKTHTARAPLRETTAAAILAVAGYRPGTVLADPMCGSGTFALEAALIAKNIPPGFFRRFAFMQWPAFRDRQWAYMKKTAGQSIKGVKHPSIWASDADPETSARLGQCVDRCNLEDAVAVSHGNFFDLRPGDMGAPSSKPKGDRPGLIVLNPPYGQRLQARDDTQKRYADIAAKLKKDFRGWHAAVLVPGGVVAKKLGLSLRPMKIDHGGLKLTLLVGRL